MHFTANEPTWWIAHGESVGHGHLAAGQSLTTGAQFFETFTDQQAFRNRLREIESDPIAARNTGAPTEPFARLAWVRWQREIGGITLPDGTQVLTTREAQAQITSTILSLSIGAVTPPVRWKAHNGWVSLGVEEMGFLAAAVSMHVKVCFQAEEVAQGQIEGDPMLDVEQAFDAAYDQLIAEEMAGLV